MGIDTLDWTKLKTKAGYTHPGYCDDCEQAGQLMRMQYSNGVWHAHMVCPDCQSKLSGSIGRDVLTANCVTMDELPIYTPAENRYERAPACPQCGLHPQMGRKTVKKMEFAVWYCKTCVIEVAPVSEEMLKAWHRRLEELPDVQVLFLRSMPYEDYLQSDWWKRVSWATKWLAGFRCQMCGSAEQVAAHHNSYDRRGEERPEDLICLCDDCHKQFHRIKKEAF